MEAIAFSSRFRHYVKPNSGDPCLILYSTQRYYDLNRVVRNNATGLLFSGNIKSKKEWENIILTSNTDKLESILDKDVVFYSPIVFTPKKGKVIVFQYLLAAVKVFQNKKFKYTNIIKSENYSFAEFEALFDNILVTLNVGFAPLDNQYFILSVLRTILSELSFSSIGLYDPNLSINLPSLGERASATTIL